MTAAELVKSLAANITVPPEVWKLTSIPAAMGLPEGSHVE